MVTIWQRIGRHSRTAWLINLLTAILVLCASFLAGVRLPGLGTEASTVLFILLLVAGVCIDTACLVLMSGIRRLVAVLILVLYAAMVFPMITWL